MHRQAHTYATQTFLPLFLLRQAYPFIHELTCLHTCIQGELSACLSHSCWESAHFLWGYPIAGFCTSNYLLQMDSGPYGRAYAIYCSPPFSYLHCNKYLCVFRVKGEFSNV